MGTVRAAIVGALCLATAAPAQEPAHTLYSLVYLTDGQAIYMDLQHSGISEGVRTITVRKIWSSPPDDQIKFDNVVEKLEFACGSGMMRMASMEGYLGEVRVFSNPPYSDTLHVVDGRDLGEQKMFQAACGPILHEFETTFQPYSDAHRRWKVKV